MLLKFRFSLLQKINRVVKIKDKRDENIQFSNHPNSLRPEIPQRRTLYYAAADFTHEPFRSSRFETANWPEQAEKPCSGYEASADA